MATPALKILLIDVAGRSDTELRDALGTLEVYLVEGSPGADPVETARKEKPDLLLVDARASDIDANSFFRADPGAPRPFGSALVLIPTIPEQGPATETIDYLATPGNTREILVRIRWHLRLIALQRQYNRLEDRFETLQRRASIGAIADGVAHNLNNVLGVIFGYLHLLKTNHREPEKILKYQQQLESAANKATEMVRRFGLAARETETDPVPTPVAGLLGDSIENFRQEMGISREFTFTVEPPDLVVETRVDAAVDALVRILKNAWESYDGLPEPNRTIEITAAVRDGDHLVIGIRDHGCGFDPEMQATFFEPFNGTKGKDGLGLTVARRCFRNLNGDLTLSNHPEGGTLVEIRHPLEL